MSYVKLVKVNKEWEGVDWINVVQDKWPFSIRQWNFVFHKMRGFLN